MTIARHVMSVVIMIVNWNWNAIAIAGAAAAAAAAAAGCCGAAACYYTLEFCQTQCFFRNPQICMVFIHL